MKAIELEKAYEPKSFEDRIYKEWESKGYFSSVSLSRTDYPAVFLTDIRTLYIDDLCVDEAVRGQGVGRALYERVEALARELGCHDIMLNVWECNPGAKAFYEALGLVPYQTGMEKILGDDGRG